MNFRFKQGSWSNSSRLRITHHRVVHRYLCPVKWNKSGFLARAFWPLSHRLRCLRLTPSPRLWLPPQRQWGHTQACPLFPLEAQDTQFLLGEPMGLLTVSLCSHVGPQSHLAPWGAPAWPACTTGTTPTLFPNRPQTQAAFCDTPLAGACSPKDPHFLCRLPLAQGPPLWSQAAGPPETLRWGRGGLEPGGLRSQGETADPTRQTSPSSCPGASVLPGPVSCSSVAEVRLPGCLSAA